MSLNRRLYSWLLGGSEGNMMAPANREVLVAALRTMFFAPNTELSELTKPYKVLISLMDRQEIGQAALDQIFIDILWSLREQYEQSMANQSELLATANMFFDMIDPVLIWKQLYHVVRNNDVETCAETTAYKLISFALTRTKWSDEETRRVHVPFLFRTLMAQLSAVHTPTPSFFARLPVFLQLCADLLNLIPDEAALTTWRLSDFGGGGGEKSLKIDTGRSMSPSPQELDLGSRIEEFYGPEDTDGVGVVDDPFQKCMDFAVGKEVVEDAFGHLRAALEFVVRTGVLEGKAMEEGVDKRDLYATLDLMCGMTGKLAALVDPLRREAKFAEGVLREVSAEPEWVRVIMDGCCKTDMFGITNVMLSCLLDLLSSPRYPIPVPSCFSDFVKNVIAKLWDNLSPDQLGYHTRTTHLIWRMADVSSPYLVENIIAGYIAGCDGETRVRQFEKFGAFWRLSEEGDRPTNVVFSRPLFLVLDALKSNDPALRRGGETWFRSYIKSYIKLLTPLLSVLLHDNIRRTSSVVRVSGEEIPVLYYASPFNAAQVDYAFSTLTEVLRMGDRGFLRSVWVCGVDDDGIVKRCGWSDDEYGVHATRMTYAELLIMLSIRYLQSEPLPTKSSIVSPHLLDSIQTRASDFLHLLLLRTESMNFQLLLTLQSVVIRKLLFCIFSARLDLQPRLLQVLHAVAGVAGGGPGGRRIKEVSVLKKGDVNVSVAMGMEQVGKDEGIKEREFPLLRTIGSSPLFVRTTLEALSMRTNRPILQHWIDFILSSLPHLRASFNRVIVPIMRCLCDELTKYRAQMSRYIRAFPTSTPVNGSRIVHDEAQTDLEAVTLLHGLEQMISFCLADNRDGAVTSPTDANHASSLRVITDYVSSVFMGDGGSGDPESTQRKVREAVLGMMHSIFRGLQELYGVFAVGDPLGESEDRLLAGMAGGGSLAFIGERIRHRIRRVVEVVCRWHLPDAIECLVEVWFAENGGTVAEEENAKYNHVSVTIMHSVASCTPRVVIATLIDGLKSRAGYNLATTPAHKEKLKRSTVRSPTLPDVSLLIFLEKYCLLWAGSGALEETWPNVSGYVKESFVQASAYKYLYPYMLKLLTVYFEKLSGMSTFDDKRVRKDAEETYQKVCDYCILIGGRAFDKGLWGGRTVVMGDSDGGTADDNGSVDALTAAALPEIAGNLKRPSKMSEDAILQELITYLGSTVIPSFRKVLQDQDRGLALMTNIVYYIVGPTFKNRQHGKILLTPILELVCAMSKIPYGFKAWRKEAWEAFQDPRFFQMGLSASKKWRVILQSIMVSDKDRFGELLGRASAAPSSTLFVSRDQEALNRAYALRRVSFAIWCGPMDQYVPQMPQIQEKLVDVLKQTSGVMHVEAYICLRVLLCRMSTKHLSNIWPTVLTELIRLFGLYLRGQDAERDEDLVVFFAACKFLDLLLVLGIEEFQWHQWIFITETVELLQDIVSGTVKPVSLIDKLHNRWGGAPAVESLAAYNTSDSSIVDETIPPVPAALGPAPPRGQHEPRLQHSHPHTITGSPLRRPLLTMRSVQDKRQLQSFVKTISAYIYQSTYSRARPDMEFIEGMIDSDFLDVEDAALGAWNSGAGGPVGRASSDSMSGPIGRSVTPPPSLLKGRGKGALTPPTGSRRGRRGSISSDPGSTASEDVVQAELRSPVGEGGKGS
ncbi:hypothetical protein HK104_007293 [Borealophlyctis nickersoniae]|nr:hypothetical protein HK104_007293 [Borealophlyctis nickersoniae]